MPIDYGLNNITSSGNVSISGIITATSGNFTSLTVSGVNSNLFVTSNTSGITGASGINNMVQISQANYDAIVTKNPNTIYFIT
jgi:hypothetical protein